MKFGKHSVQSQDTARLPFLYPSETIQSLFPSCAQSEIINSAVISELFTAKEWNGTPFVRVSVKSSQSHIKLDSMIWLLASAANPAKLFFYFLFNDKHYDGYRLRLRAFRDVLHVKNFGYFCQPLESSPVWSVSHAGDGDSFSFCCCCFFAIISHQKCLHVNNVKCEFEEGCKYVF